MKLSNKSLDEISRAHLGSEVVEPIYNTDQLLDLLQLSRRTLQKWRDTGIIKFSSIGSKFYYRHSDVLKMLNKNSIN